MAKRSVKGREMGFYRMMSDGGDGDKEEERCLEGDDVYEVERVVERRVKKMRLFVLSVNLRSSLLRVDA